jgi:hypothetical protein
MKDKILFLILLTCFFSFQFHHAVANNQNESKQNSAVIVTTGSDDPTSDILSKDRLSLLTDENGRLLNKNKYLPPDSETDAIQQRYFTGYVADDFFGYSVANAGDVNGDGFDDLIVGAPQNDAVAPDAGRAYIYFGGSIVNSGVDVILSGAATGDKFGWAVSGAGDLNSDGYDDVIVGAPFNDNGGTDAGRAYIYFGGSPMNNSVDVTLTGSNAQDNFGLSVSAAGDVNANGFADVIVGAPGSDGGGTNAGRAQIYFGGNPMNNSVDVTLNGLTAQDNFGTSVSYAGDVNGDGFSDVICGAPNNDAAGTNAGRAYVYLGSNPMNTTADLTVTGAAANDIFGYSVSGNGDVNGDGYSDVVSGAPLNDAGGSYSGSVYVYFGGATLDNTVDVTLAGMTGEYFGHSVSIQGDLNGDGYSDILAGAPNNGAVFTDAGRTYVYYGGSSVDNIRDVMFSGENSLDNLGFKVAFAGDVNGDGYTDILAGAPFNNAGGTASGKVYLYMNSMTGSDIADEYFTGSAANFNLGYSVSGAGDVNGDGYSDMIIGAFGYNSNQGIAYIFFGGSILDNTADVTMTGETAGDVFGHAVSGAGDVNSDGFADVVVGAHFNDAGGSAAGRAYIYFGGASMNNSADVIINGAAANDNHGWSVSSAGDVNGDGYSDIIIGVTGDDYNGTNAGKAVIYFGGQSMNNVADVSLYGGSFPSDFCGHSVSTAGDVNGDGYDDVIVGSIYNDDAGTNAGSAYLYFGGSTMNGGSDLYFTGEAASDEFGSSVSSAGDINGDGISDVIIGAPRNDAGGTNAGRTYIYFGGLSLNGIADVTMTGETDGDELGYSVSTAGDVNNDGFSDVIIGAPKKDVVSNDEGRVYIHFGGSSMDNIAEVTITGNSPEYLGHSVSSAGDVNADGLADVIVGAFANSYNGTSSGRGYLYLSSSPPINPRAISAKDVPYDQGGVLKLKWVRSGNDYQGGGSIVNYLIQQSPPPGITGFMWSSVMTVPATNTTYYSQNVSTDNDSMSNNSGTMFYRITAQTSDMNNYWRSNIISGYSVDNLAPFAPQNLAGTPDNNSIYLTWNQNLEGDLHHYIIYRDGAELATSTTNDFDDAAVTNGSNYDYEIAAVDIHGNIGRLSNLINVPFNNSGSITLTAIMEGFFDYQMVQMRISDTCEVFLRNSSSPYAIVDSYVSVIEKTSLTGVFNMLSAPTGNYYISVKHRNTIEVWSANPVSYTAGSNTNYDLTSAASQAYGSNLIQVSINPDAYGIFSGDVNQDGTVDATDVSTVDNDAFNFVGGYVVTDLTGDDFVDATDFAIADNNASNFVSVVTP